MYKATLVLTRYKESNSMLFKSLKTISTQKQIVLEILLLDQFFNETTRKYCDKLFKQSNHTIKYIKIKSLWTSYAKNYWINISSNDIVLFSEPDMLLNNYRWYKMVDEFYNDKKVCMMISKIVPHFKSKWHFLTKSSIILEQFSVLDLWNEVFYTTRCLNWWLHIARLKKIWITMFFDEKLWRKKWILFWWEETDLSNRIKNKWGELLYNWKVTISHYILDEKNNLYRILNRFFYAGVSRKMRWWLPSPISKKRNIYDYIFIPILMPIYIAWYLYWYFK